MEGSWVDKITVMIVDEQEFFRGGVRIALSQQSDFNILDFDAQDPLGLIEVYLPDIVLLGPDVGAYSGLELIRLIVRNYPTIKVIMLSHGPSDEELFEVIKTAAVACLNRKATAEVLISTIRQAYRGEYPINDSLTTRPMVARHVLNQFQNMAPMGKAMEDIVAPLTNRETEILGYVADGNSNKQIAYILGISEQTVKSHISAILRKLNANDRAHAVSLAMRDGWLSASDTKPLPEKKP